MEDQTRNIISATLLSLVVIVGWFLLFPPEAQAPQPDTDEVATEGTTTGSETGLAGTAEIAEVTGAEEQVAIDAPRIEIETPSLNGSLSLRGGRIDDLSLTRYHETLDPTSPLVRLLSPIGSDAPYYALWGWTAPAGDEAPSLPGPDTLWQAETEGSLTPETPVTLVWDNGEGLIFRRTISVDENYMFDVAQSVENTTDTPVTLAPYGFVARHGQPDTQNFFILHEGVVRMTDGTLEEIKYKNMDDLDPDPSGRGRAEALQVAENGWTGFTDKYWMTTLIPTQGAPFRSVVRFNEGTQVYQTDTVLPAQEIAPGASLATDTRLFAGAKEWEAIRDYQNEGGIPGFVDSIDWGWFFFLTKPIFWLLHFLHGFIGNMGWSILVLTLILKALVFPLSYKSYVSMARMKELQPEMEKLKERAGDDKQALQQGMMKLYRDNKVNPASGCLPMLLQIPIFFSLYKVIFVTLELRHAPWIGWIHDLSAPDPTSILNLFGLLPYAAPGPDSILAIISLGVLPILLGASMWLQQKLNPAPTDPTQRMVFAWMPLIFMFMLGHFASGLVLYWIANNTITFVQQYLIMRSHGAKPDVFGNIRSTFRRKQATEK
ncbi:membrane protein insertase YidC [Pseudoroseicyclus aestuarii]|uniref:Membrane protein insertase YidC n=1 Tax=Pseudoroseicyclus aestuarii TaxID=1795041 RepID=A0A318SU49_9RHOB|nr:membrane protein insertase YidC [Pseudoroseicyclus aestuarii]PYE83766.1 protein translocase subunit yidC [Pseudoroseicyclus aestuarii]